MIHVSTWGKRGIGTIAVRCKEPGYHAVLDAVVRSICRRTGLAMCAGPCGQGTSLRNGKPESEHYSATLGRPCRLGGYNVVGEIWFAIPVRKREELPCA